MLFRLRKLEIALLVISLICAVAGITTWIVFPRVYPSQVAKHLEFKQNSDTSLGYSSFMMANPPMHNVMRFYFFNVTNPDEIKYKGARPMINEVGPFAVVESEHKKYMKWNEDGTEVFYENYKRYGIHEEYSCEGCSFDQKVTIPNPTEIGATADIFDPKYNVTDVGRQIIAMGLILMGEYPFVTQSVRDILFDGYEDALLSAAHSELIAVISNVFNGGQNIIPIPVPTMLKMGFFQGYNNTRDENYWIDTGKKNIDSLGKVIKWNNSTALPDDWWPTEYSRSIRGSDSGSFCKTHLEKNDVLPMFHSFMCRSFNKTFLEETTVHSIPSYTYTVAYEDYDTTSDINIGFRYKNVEKVNYYPDWPSCPDKNSSLCVSGPSPVNCSLQENLCHNCCNGSFVEGTFLVPPGIFPLVCYPGRMQPTPFAVMYSPPHFLYSPPQMVNSVYGLRPNASLHRPFLYSHEPFSGTTTEVAVQLMVSMPVMKSPVVVQNMHMADSIIPIFWQGARADLLPSTYHLIWLGFVFVPRIVDAIKYFLCALALFLIAITVMCVLRRTKNAKKLKDDETF